MKKLDKGELLKVEGGSISIGTGVVLVSLVSFAFGVLDGYFRPLKCH